MKTIKTTLYIICFCFAVQPATSLVAAGDANEQGVTDNRDFKDSKVEFNSGSGDITADVLFYDHPNLGEFWLYISTDKDNVADYQVRCHASYFSVREHTSGTVGPEVYRGTPTLRRGKYNLKFPIRALGLRTGTRNIIQYWFFWIAGGGSDADRWPDSGTFQLRTN